MTPKAGDTIMKERIRGNCQLLNIGGASQFSFVFSGNRLLSHLE